MSEMFDYGDDTEESDSPDELLNLTVQRELLEALIRERQLVYSLKRLVEELRCHEFTVESSIRHRPMVRTALAAITWADDLQEAREIATRALREDYGFFDSIEGRDPNHVSTPAREG